MKRIWALVIVAIVIAAAGFAVGRSARDALAPVPTQSSRESTAAAEIAGLRATAAGLRTSLTEAWTDTGAADYARAVEREPAGDIKQDANGVSFVGLLSAVSTSPLSITVDIESLVPGNGPPPRYRNRVQHQQTLPVRDAFISVAVPDGATVDWPYGTDPAEYSEPGFWPRMMTFEEFAAAAARNPDLLKGPWSVVTDSEGVVSVSPWPTQ
jgi:hypothetical protein